HNGDSMSDTPNLGFGKFVPGFDFLQNLAKGASQNIPQMPNLANWIAPTLNLEELEKRLEELKAVHFWLDQNSKALGATIQALEVQKMTLATLKGMNFNMGDVANALKLKAADTVFTGVQKVTEKAADTAKTISNVASGAAKKGGAGASGVVDPLQWWGALTNQFQQIAATAMKDAARQTAVDTTKNMATGLAKEAFKTATGMAGAMTRSAAKSVSAGAPKKPAKKAARKSTASNR
ncbi:MAG TPA: PhaM family polyhydroxyalkanoate granule multifunctional regulatory protein, partial [Burkholderiaceae bacterium]|nr:PhaM family polyhydroxyalkanoate granule multifunctional regulatory protein [Burkholderiaceae bacterium]